MHLELESTLWMENCKMTKSLRLKSGCNLFAKMCTFNSDNQDPTAIKMLTKSGSVHIIGCTFKDIENIKRTSKTRRHKAIICITDNRKHKYIEKIKFSLKCIGNA